MTLTEKIRSVTDSDPAVLKLLCDPVSERGVSADSPHCGLPV